ncbi:MAG: hypothetical protein PWQ97_1010 [Tepidanaerobacteraceae bacterium]|nr:hypothetical protein [Tepidanaerobacteraceae bacterium]
MKKSVYILIFAAILLCLLGPMILPHINSGNGPGAALSKQQAVQGPKALETHAENPVEQYSEQNSDSVGSAQEQSQAGISREKGNTSDSSSMQKGSDENPGDEKDDFSKNLPDKSETQKKVPSDSSKAAQKNDGANKNASMLPEEKEEQDKASPDDAAAETEKGIKVSLAVVGSGGKIIFGPAKVIIKDDNKWGATALGALEASGVEYVVSSRYAGFVTSIAGQANEGMKGWMYEVNDKVPMAAAADMKLVEGDRVLWWYSESLDKPPPAWDKLEKAQ